MDAVTIIETLAVGRIEQHTDGRRLVGIAARMICQVGEELVEMVATSVKRDPPCLEGKRSGYALGLEDGAAPADVRNEDIRLHDGEADCVALQGSVPLDLLVPPEHSKSPSLDAQEIAHEVFEEPAHLHIVSSEVSKAESPGAVFRDKVATHQPTKIEQKAVAGVVAVNLHAIEQIVAQLHFGDFGNAPRQALEVSAQAAIEVRVGPQATHRRLDDPIVEHVAAQILVAHMHLTSDP